MLGGMNVLICCAAFRVYMYLFAGWELLKLARESSSSFSLCYCFLSFFFLVNRVISSCNVVCEGEKVIAKPLRDVGVD